MAATRLCIFAGIALGVVFTASPLAVIAIALMVPVVTLAGRGLPSQERRLVTGIVVAALALRAALIGALFVIGLPHHNDLAIGALAGDDAYYLSRAIRGRDIMLGFTGGKYDYFVVNDEYGRTSYVGLLTALQLVFGPTPFSIRLLNAVLFTIGALALFRTARHAFGPLPAICGLVVLLAIPSLLWTSISVLKESAYFFCSSLLVYCAAAITRSRSGRRTLMLVAVSAALLWMLDDLRRGAFALAAAGLTLAIILRVVAATPVRLAGVGAACFLIGALALTRPDVQERAVTAVENAARVHGGHVFTQGHAYKLLDDGFYKNPAAPGSWPLELTTAQAGRFVVRALISFVTTPWPWQMSSRGELAFLPEQIIWYVLMIGVPAGLVAGWQREPWTVAILAGYVMPVVIAVALTNGNVGTLLRMRGLITPYLLWVGVLGVIVMANAIIERQRNRAPRFAQPAMEGGAP